MSVKQQIIKLTKDLISYQTLPDNKLEVKRAFNCVLDQVKDADLEVVELSNNNVVSLLIKPRNKEHLDILFHGHIDVVPGTNDQFKPKIKGNRIYGRGSADMKGALAVLIILAKNLLANSNHGLLITSDEETGGNSGTGLFIKNSKVKCNYFITGEPTDLDLGTEEKGVIWLTMAIKGKSAHAATPWQGSNPILKLENIIQQLNRLYPVYSRKWSTTVTPTIISSLNSQNQIPSLLQIKCDCRYVPEDDPNKIIQEISKLSDGIEVQLIEPPLTNIKHPYTNYLSKISPGKKTKINFASDARFFSQKGIPAVIFGPGGENIHGPNEYVDINSLLKYYDLLEKLVKRSV